MYRTASWLWLVPALLVVGCTEPEVGQGNEYSTEIEPQINWQRDIIATDLRIDLEALQATAVIQLDESESRGASLEVGDLTIQSVRSAAGPVKHRVVDGRLDVGIESHGHHELTIDYGLSVHDKLEGFHSSGASFLWPYFCGNLFPCKSDPADGLQFDLTLSGLADGTTAVYPAHIAADAPSYMIAWATGDYTELSLGVTETGRQVSVFFLPGEEQVAQTGTQDLVAAFDWLESTYGTYLYGDHVGSVSTDWGPGAFGGMEHHPFWHVSSDSMGDRETHVHEAAHGWFGNGVRIACWEDLTLSEGTVSYLTARAMEAVRGPAAGAEVWSGYEWRLNNVIEGDDRIAWPQTCGEIDVYHDLWNGVVYMKGAFFFRAVEQAIGREALDGVIARFYQAHMGGAAGVGDMLDAIEADTGFDPSELATGWLQSLGRPDQG
ncbi:MAG: peptidase M1 [Deltaproteobacteria bacterium]|nr:peptidase M1 [Deltaproteobacteria bacterium]